MPRVPDDAPELTATERKHVEAIATAAAQQAQAAKAMSYLPFPDLADGPRLVATWLKSLRDLYNFFGSQIKPANTSVQVSRVVRGNEMSAGTCYGRDYETFIRSLTNAFCLNRESDEVHELIAIKWVLRVPTTRPSATIQPRSRLRKVTKVPGEYVNQAQRGAKKETPEQIAIKAAEAQGGKTAKKVKEAYKNTFAEVWAEEEERIKADVRRNRRVAIQETRRDQKDAAKEERKNNRRSKKS